MTAPTWGTLTPDLAAFRELATSHRVIPVARVVLAEDLSPTAVYRAFGGGPGTFILESAERGRWSRWSFVGAATRAYLLSHDGRAEWLGDMPVGVPTEGDVLEVLAGAVAALPGAKPEGFPPLTGGFVGAIGWDAVRGWEDLPDTTVDDLTHPRVAMGLVSDLVAVDHHTGAVWLIANAINANGTADGVDEAWDDAVARVDAMAARLSEVRVDTALRVLGDAPEPAPRELTTRDSFIATVTRLQAAIAAGEVGQVVPSIRLDVDTHADPLDVYRVLRATNPSPYMYLVSLPDQRRDSGRIDVVGSSPETLVRVADGQAMTFPIGGTRPRPADPADEDRVTRELLADPKERAEHRMLVDLAEEELARTCDAVEVAEYMSVRAYSHVLHITSTVTGVLRHGVSALDVLRDVFPAGTLSGSPKPRAMQLIDECEPTRRGLYGGVIGYLDLAGNMDMAIAIRTAMIADGTASVQAGAGVVAESDPEREYEECRNKAAAALRAVQLAERLERP